MRYLIDTHVLLWAVIDDDKLSVKIKKVMEDGRNDIFVSSISFWEIALKFSLGKLKIGNFSPDELPSLIEKMGFKLISLAPADSSTYHQFVFTGHKDPFDRMLMWQAIQQEMTFISKDRNVSHYRGTGLQVIW